MWSISEIAGKQVDLCEPAAGHPRFGLLYLHDIDGKSLREDLSMGGSLSSQSLACACPLGGPYWWSSRLCPDFDVEKSAESWLMADVLPFMANRWRLDSNSIAIAGAGMGGQAALRLAFKYPEQFSIVGALDAALDHHELYDEGTPLDRMYPSREHCRQDTAILHIHPAKQPAHIWFGADPGSRWFRGNDRLHEKLSALGISHTFIERSGIGGDWNALLKFLGESLEVQSRRLL